MDNIYAVKETTITVEKKPLALILPSFQTRTNLKKSLKNILNCCKLQIEFEYKTRSGKNFHFKDRITRDLTSGLVYNFQCGLGNGSYYDESVKDLNVRIGKSY